MKGKASVAAASTSEAPKSASAILLKAKGDGKDRLTASGVRLDELQKRVSVSTLLAAAERFKPTAEKDEDSKTSKSKWTVAGVIKQLKTGKITLKFLSTVSDVLKTKENVEKFVAGNGFGMLVELPEKNDYKHKQDAIKAAIVECLRSNLSGPKVLEHVAERPDVLTTIVSWANTTVAELKALIFYLLAILPYCTDDTQLSLQVYVRVTNALEFYCTKNNEDYRFQHLVNILKHELNDKIVLAVLSLVYMLVNLPDALEDRWALRMEFRTHDIDRIFKRIQDTPDRKSVV